MVLKLFSQSWTVCANGIWETLLSLSEYLGASNLQPVAACSSGWLWTWPNTKLQIYLKHWDFFVIICHNVFNVWPKTTFLLPVWRRDAKRLDTPDRIPIKKNQKKKKKGKRKSCYIQRCMHPGNQNALQYSSWLAMNRKLAPHQQWRQIKPSQTTNWNWKVWEKAVANQISKVYVRDKII